MSSLKVCDLMKIISRFLILLVFYCVNAQSQNDPETLTFGYVEMPPFTYTNSAGKADGFVMKLVDKVFKESGILYQTISLPAIRLREQLKSGKIDVWVGIDTKESNNEFAIVSKKVFINITLRAYFIADKCPVNAKNDLNNQSVITLRGYSYGGLDKYINDKAHNIINSQTKSHASGFQMLKLARADYFLGYNLPAQEYLKKHPIPKIQSSLLSSFPLYFIFSKQTENAREIINQLESSMAFQLAPQNAITN